MNTIDFLVEIPENKTPVILQLSDPQILDPSQAAQGRLSKDECTYWEKDKKEERCFAFIRETIENTAPDLILIAGDVTYGEFDHDGSALQAFIEFMDSFEIPWAPVLGNHETESGMGADWQCAQLEKSKHCLFKQRTLTGNGNYTVGIKQGETLSRVFYMLDSNAGNPSAHSLANGHSQHPAGFGEDQIAWYTGHIQTLKKNYPQTKISFVFHIAISAFEKAYEKYGYESEVAACCPIDIDRCAEKADGDFGYILHPFDVWDKEETVWKGLKELGVDCICVGHDHEVCASVVYEGVRFQFGLKSSTYDSNLYQTATGELVKSWTPAGTPIVGGTVMELSLMDGSIEKAYHYYCKKVRFEKN
ncbi:MAG: metallophosphoesterase [Clostridia bacterium]|nr:metallophosphoesterase [Clostridia bacterium]